MKVTLTNASGSRFLPYHRRYTTDATSATLHHQRYITDAKPPTLHHRHYTTNATPPTLHHRRYIIDTTSPTLHHRHNITDATPPTPYHRRYKNLSIDSIAKHLALSSYTQNHSLWHFIPPFFARDSSVGTATCYRLDCPRIKSRWI